MVGYRLGQINDLKQITWSSTVQCQGVNALWMGGGGGEGGGGGDVNMSTAQMYHVSFVTLSHVWLSGEGWLEYDVSIIVLSSLSSLLDRQTDYSDLWCFPVELSSRTTLSASTKLKRDWDHSFQYKRENEDTHFKIRERIWGHSFQDSDSNNSALNGVTTWGNIANNWTINNINIKVHPLIPLHCHKNIKHL